MNRFDKSVARGLNTRSVAWVTTRIVTATKRLRAAPGLALIIAHPAQMRPSGFLCHGCATQSCCKTRHLLQLPGSTIVQTTGLRARDAIAVCRTYRPIRWSAVVLRGLEGVGGEGRSEWKILRENRGAGTNRRPAVSRIANQGVLFSAFSDFETRSRNHPPPAYRRFKCVHRAIEPNGRPRAAVRTDFPCCCDRPRTCRRPPPLLPGGEGLERWIEDS